MSKTSYKISILLFTAVFALTVFVLPAEAIRIGLIKNSPQAVLGVSEEGVITDARTNREIMDIFPMKAYILSNNGNRLNISHNGNNYEINSNAIYIKTKNPNGFVFAKKKWYRGEFLAFVASGGITLTNEIDIESYIRGVVPSEMPSKWNPEALKAQAIAARSYAVANMGKHAGKGFDLTDTTEDQCYGGASAETVKTNDAVSSTRGQVLVYGNKVIPAYYHASSGGQTLPSGEVWGKNLPFIRPVIAYDSNVPKNGHGVGMSQYGANYLANYGYNAYQILGYFYRNVKLYYLQY